jgi:glucose-6-phosphate 1-dehydrogenase
VYRIDHYWVKTVQNLLVFRFAGDRAGLEPAASIMQITAAGDRRRTPRSIERRV